MAYFVSTSFDAAKYSPCIPTLVPTVDHNYAGYTFVTKYMPYFLQSSGTKVRLRLRGPIAPGGTVTLSKVTISLAANATTSDLYDSSATPTNVTFRGADAVSLTRNGYALSDDITFTIDRSRAVLVAYNVSSSGGGIVPFAVQKGPYVSTYRLTAVAQAGTANRTSGYLVTSGASVFLYEMDTFTE
jgi:hypothetical protein